MGIVEVLGPNCKCWWSFQYEIIYNYFQKERKVNSNWNSDNLRFGLFVGLTIPKFDRYPSYLAGNMKPSSSKAKSSIRGHQGWIFHGWYDNHWRDLLSHYIYIYYHKGCAPPYHLDLKFLSALDNLTFCGLAICRSRDFWGSTDSLGSCHQKQLGPINVRKL